MWVVKSWVRLRAPTHFYIASENAVKTLISIALKSKKHEGKTMDFFLFYKKKSDNTLS